MANNTWKQQKREWQMARWQEEQARKERDRAAAVKREQQNAILRANGYTWRKVQDVFGPSDDGDRAGYVWTLYAPDGSVTTVAVALAAIAAAK